MKEPALSLRADPDAGVPHLDADPVFHAPGRRLDADLHRAAVSELDRVVEEIRQDLAQPPGISVHARRHSGPATQDQTQPFALGGQREDFDRLLHQT